MHAASCHSEKAHRVIASPSLWEVLPQKDAEAISAMSHERVILSAAKNLGRYADLCNQALAVEHGLEV